jgi:hypothetical protein
VGLAQGVDSLVGSTGCTAENERGVGVDSDRNLYGKERIGSGERFVWMDYFPTKLFLEKQYLVFFAHAAGKV